MYQKQIEADQKRLTLTWDVFKSFDYRITKHSFLV